MTKKRNKNRIKRKKDIVYKVSRILGSAVLILQIVYYVKVIFFS